MALSPTDRQILELEQRFYRHPGIKEQAIRDGFGWDSTTYYARLVRLLSDPEAALEFPQLVARLRRLLDQRMRQRVRKAG